MLERFFEAKSFGLHISNPKQVLGNIIFDVSKMIVRLRTLYACCLCIMAMYHGYASWLCIMVIYHGYVSWLCIMAMYHGLYIIKTIAANPRRSIFEKCFKSCFDRLERQSARKCILKVDFVSPDLLSASSYGRNKFRIEFRSQCRILRVWTLVYYILCIIKNDSSESKKVNF